MTKLKIISDESTSIDIIKSAILSEIKRLEIGLNRTETEITRFEEKYHTTSETFLENLSAEDLTGGDEEYIMWAGELKIRDRILADLKRLREIEYVAD